VTVIKLNKSGRVSKRFSMNPVDSCIMDEIVRQGPCESRREALSYMIRATAYHMGIPCPTYKGGKERGLYPDDGKG